MIPRPLLLAVALLSLLPALIPGTAQAKEIGTLVMSGDPTFNSDSIACSADPSMRWNSYPGGRFCLNPSTYKKFVMAPLGAGLELELGAFLGTNVVRMPEVMSIAVADRGAKEGRASISRQSTWYPYKLEWKAAYPGGVTVEGYDSFLDADSTLIRVIKVESKEGNEGKGKGKDLILSGHIYGDKVSTWDSKGDSKVRLLVVSDGKYDYALRFVSLPDNGKKAANVVDVKAVPTIAKDRWSLRIPLKNASETFAISFGVAPSSEGRTVAIERARKAFERPVAESLAATKGVMDDQLRRVPKPLTWGLEGIKDFGVTPQKQRAAYYQAWTFLCQSTMNIQPGDAAYPYPQMTVGKSSLWAEGEQTSPATCGWESLMGLQWYSFLDPEFSWTAFQGIMSRVEPNGMLGGESLPSRKAQTAWILYSRDQDVEKLKAAYPALKRYMLWREQNPRWLYISKVGVGHNREDEKDLEFTASWLFDLGYLMKITKQLGMEEETAMWQAKVKPMIANMRAWYFDNPKKVHQFKFLATGANYDKKLRPDDRSTLMLSAIGTGDCLPPEMFAALKRDFLGYHHPERSVDGFPECKYPDANLIAYGLIDRNQSEAKPFIQAMLRDTIRAGFAEVTKTGPEPEGVKPSLFSPLEIIEFTWLLNGVRYDSGHPKQFTLPAVAPAK